jgi:hypothetical protein
MIGETKAEKTFYALGTQNSITAFGENAENAVRIAMSRVFQIHYKMSAYDLYSEISMISKNAGISPVRISDDVLEVLVQALLFSEYSNGAFDLTISPLYYRLITDEELLEIRRIWIEEKYEFDDSLPRIYADVTGRELNVKKYSSPFTSTEYDILKAVCEENYEDEELLFKMTASLLEVERKEIGSRYRSGVIKKLTDIVHRPLLTYNP